MQITPIHRVQGTGLFSPLEGQEVTLRGVVTGKTRKGFFLQDPEGDVHAPISHGLFVFERGRGPAAGSLVEVRGRVVDYLPDEDARPTTQLKEYETRVLQERGPRIEPVWLTAETVLVEHNRLREFLNHLEGMLVGVPAGAIFVAPSNPFGDYVLLPPGADLPRTQAGGVLIDPEVPERWLPGFRLLDYDVAPRVNVGAQLLEPVVGPLNFRVASFQIAAAGGVRVQPVEPKPQRTSLKGMGARVTVLTLNGFNLDAQREDPAEVHDPRRDVDDDVGDGRFGGLAQAIVRDAAAPDIVALQEIQDDDGAELSTVVSAGRTLECLVAAVRRAGGPTYRWLDLAPEEGADGGQPGGNIRNAFLFNPERLGLVEGSLKRLGESHSAFESSRKPLVARFALAGGRGRLEVINVHLASKRHQQGLFAPERPGFDPRLAVRVEQAQLIGEHLAALRAQGVDYYVTGDFNDYEFSATLRTLKGDHSMNLVELLPPALRFDYNHRGLSQALTHGVVAKRQLEGRQAEYEILNGNALWGTAPGRKGGKASDHGYAIARLQLEP